MYVAPGKTEAKGLSPGGLGDPYPWVSMDIAAAWVHREDINF